jgi:uncharacterized protein
MTEHPNVTLLRTGYAAFAKGDLDRIRELFTPDVVHRVPGRSPLAGDYRTEEEILEFYTRLFELSDGTYRSEPYAFMATDDYGVALVETHADRAGRTLDDRGAEIFRIVDGKISEIRCLPGDQYAQDEFWV